MLLKIVTPERVVVETEVESFVGKTIDGMIGIQSRHIPLVTPLTVGIMSYTQNGQKYPLAVMGGLLSTDGKQVTVLTDAAELSREIDSVRATRAKERAEAELRQLSDRREIAQAQESLARALTRLKLVNGKKG
ncbi:ATP synthase F1 subunit epsilon [Vampirovibrio chlorellavorus]|uniref:ATP synthase F1 subunit epsilon n=1 Tax=Vampirovibrio chlorellavorus TaxID=758823 RepID=UPI0026EEE737|nr:ATP synthase F1 subunit epsilon [Vampirovibrio chlorellavorus]